MNGEGAGLKNFVVGLKARREALWLTQEDLADQAGIHRTSLSDVERGSRNICLMNIERMTEALQIKLSKLFEAINR